MSTARALCIPPAVLALPTVSWPARLVLAEVLALHKAQGCVWAQDEYFVGRCLLSLRTVQAAVKELVDAGLVARLTKQSAQHKRVLTPTLPPDEGAEAPADAAGTYRESCGSLPQISREPTADSAGIIKKRIKEENKGSENAASAASPTSSFSVEKVSKGNPTARQKKAARAEELAALPLPHPGPKFAQLWADFLTSPKQTKKPLTAHRLMLAKLGDKPEGFAIVMLEAAIQGDWQGIENGGTAKAFEDWQAAQARRPVPPFPTARPAATSTADPAINHAFVAEQEAREQEELARQQAEWRAEYATPAFDPAQLHGHTQTAAEGLAQNRDTPEYRQYLAETNEQSTQPADTPPGPKLADEPE